MNRPVKELLTPVEKKKVVIKEWLTGGEVEEISNVFLQDLSFDVKGRATSGKIKASLVSKSNDKAIEMAVVSVDGKKENVLSEIKNLRVEDYQFVIDEINRISTIEQKKRTDMSR